ncbi:MAG: peptidase M22 [Ruminococcus sp.]|jgi:N6-L-threonylcarbamoyladenine synthase|nr:peptidase M22 [Ruminococcus sp.]
MLYLGLDTSNYTTSAAVYDSETGCVYKAGKLLPVKPGELGVRQSDALFHHTVQLPGVVAETIGAATGKAGLNEDSTADCTAKLREKISAIGVSSRPRNVEGSYMPCFLAGVTAAEIIGSVNNIPVHKTSHQVGHILAALYSVGRLDLVNRPFNAFHISGGTTDMLLCTPDDDEILRCEIVAASADLKAGQLVDRVGVMLGLPFPCGPELEKLAENGLPPKKINVPMKNGSPCFSGAENKCRKMFEDNIPPEDIARYVLSYIETAIMNMINANASCDTIVFAGGVMSNKLIRKSLEKIDREKYFAAPGYSSDNAVGAAVYAYLKENS